MSIIHVNNDPSGILKKKCKPVVSFDKHLRSVIRIMKETQKRLGALGIAANQVGEPIRVIICGKQIMINPVITTSTDPFVSTEGCWSLPSLLYKVNRSGRIEVRFWSEHGIAQWRTYYLTEAAVVQHEIDHLDGILLTDRVKEKQHEDIK